MRTNKRQRHTVEELGIFGNAPLFDEPKRVGVPNISTPAKFRKALADIFQRKWLTNEGKYVQRFENMIQEYTGVRNAIAVNNGTTGLEIAIRALGLSGEVIVPSYTFIATPHSLLWSGISPIFCDIDPGTYNIDVNKAAQLINKRTSGIIAVDVYGRPSAKEELESLAKEHDIALIFDSAHAFGNSHHGRMIGNFGDAEVFSFHATKYLNTFEGGAITTNNDQLAKKMRAIRNFGFVGENFTEYLGINGKMNEVSAAMGITNLENIHTVIEANRTNYEAYMKYLKDLPGIKMIEYQSNEKHNYQYIIIEVYSNILGLNRDELSLVLERDGVITRKYFWPACHELEPYKTLFPEVGKRLLVTEEISNRVLALPTGTSVSKDDVASICDIIRLSSMNPGKVKKQVRKHILERGLK